VPMNPSAEWEVKKVRHLWLFDNPRREMGGSGCRTQVGLFVEAENRREAEDRAPYKLYTDSKGQMEYRLPHFWVPDPDN